ncbi:hypothetical protein [Zestomonas carbonaria]|uniref:VCBS repeat-containing protein n=1 Tax=Zestomonas carbonaria TaxID=2762745 RepID=A0A7U7ESY2_9GAMM|nr:hypothetical protein [Pseudomonas carbonaria]CAD5110597.1 hypothetical protein PSEWESI4_04920 [Pseudomonas carbonaria]
MKQKYLLALKIILFLFLPLYSQADETIAFIKGDLDGDNKNDEVKIFSIQNSEYYGLSANLSSGKKFENREFIPSSNIASKGGIQVFNGIAINNGIINIF